MPDKKRHFHRQGEAKDREPTMTIDKTLKIRRGAGQSRSVLTRVERLENLKEADRWQEGDSPLGLPKVRVRKLQLKKKKKKKKEDDDAVETEVSVDQ
jgi:small basic protein (TIGR04137 family)